MAKSKVQKLREEKIAKARLGKKIKKDSAEVKVIKAAARASRRNSVRGSAARAARGQMLPHEELPRLLETGIMNTTCQHYKVGATLGFKVYHNPLSFDEAHNCLGSGVAYSLGNSAENAVQELLQENDVPYIKEVCNRHSEVPFVVAKCDFIIEVGSELVLIEVKHARSVERGNKLLAGDKQTYWQIWQNLEVFKIRTALLFVYTGDLVLSLRGVCILRKQFPLFDRYTFPQFCKNYCAFLEDLFRMLSRTPTDLEKTQFLSGVQNSLLNPREGDVKKTLGDFLRDNLVPVKRSQWCIDKLATKHGNMMKFVSKRALVSFKQTKNRFVLLEGELCHKRRHWLCAKGKHCVGENRLVSETATFSDILDHITNFRS